MIAYTDWDTAMGRRLERWRIVSEEFSRRTDSLGPTAGGGPPVCGACGCCDVGYGGAALAGYDEAPLGG